MIPLAKRAMSARNGDHGYFVWITTVSGSGVWMSLIATSMNPQPWSSTRASSIENLTSAEVMGWPFENLTPGRSLNV